LVSHTVKGVFERITRIARSKYEGDLGKTGNLPEGIESAPSAPKKLADHRVFRTIVFLAVLLLATYVAFFRLGFKDWHPDEPIYRDAGLEYVQAHDFSENQQHPFLVKYILGVTQVVFGSSEAGVVRFPAATATLLTGLTLFVFARRVAGYWSGVLALALWTISPLTLKFGRVVFLETFLMLFSSSALYLGWRWAETRSSWFAAFSGVAVGLAIASKVVGILLLPAILLVGLLKIGLSRRLILQSMLIGSVVAATMLATYAPAWSDAPSAIRYMFEYTSQHNDGGHAVTVNDVVYYYPPWWAHLWWQWELYGTLASLSLGVAVAIALLRRRPLELYLLAAALVPFLVLSFLAQVKLAHHYSVWQPPLILLLALAAGKLVRQGITGAIFAILLLAPFIYLGAETVKDVSHTQPGPYAAVVEHLEATGHDKGPIVVWGQGSVVKAYLPEATVIYDSERTRIENLATQHPEEEIEAVIVDTNVTRRRPRPEIEEYLADNRDVLSLIYKTDDKKIEVYTHKPGG